MSRRNHPALPPLVCACGSLDWVACKPGSDDSREAGRNVLLLRKPQPEAMQVWCANCWPWWGAAAPPTKPARRRSRN